MKYVAQHRGVTRFSKKISIINGNPYVRPPNSVLIAIFKQTGKKTSPIPVTGRINGAKFQQSLVRYQGDWRLYVNIIMAKAACIKFSKSIREIVGNVASFEIEFDPKPRIFEMVPLLKNALEDDTTAKTNWEKLIPSRKKEILRYFSWLKSDEARKRNLKNLLEALTSGEKRFMARTWKDGK